MSIVLLGEIGSGKTTFYNKLTNSNEKTKSGGQSQTRLVFMKQSSYGNGFKVMDTPGFGSDSNKLDHVAGVLSALTEGPLNRIFFLIRFARTPLIVQSLKRLLPAFMKYRVMITVVITFWDDCKPEDEQSNKADIEATLKKYQITSVMYARKPDIGETLCRQIDQIIACTPQQSVNLTQEEIFRNFDIVEFGEDEDGYFFELEMQQGEIIKDYHQFYDQAIRLIKESQSIDKDDLSEYFNAITQFAKKHLDDTVLKFQMNSLNKIDQLDEIDQFRAYQLVLDLKLKIYLDYENIIEHTLKQANTTTKYFTNYIRKCYHCGQVWIKVQGCGGTTICGRLLDSKQDDAMSHGVPTKFLVTYENKKLKINLQEKKNTTPKSNDIAKNLATTEQTKSKFKTAQDSNEQIGIGCGRAIDWAKMIILNEKELNEILQVMDKTLQAQIQEQEETTKQRAQNIQSKYQNQLQSKIEEKREQTQKIK